MAPSSQPAPALPVPDVPREPVYAVWPPKVESREALDLLVAEIVRCDALEVQVAARTKNETARLKIDAASSLTVQIEGAGEPLTIEDWRARLEEAAEKFAVKHRDELLAEGRKSFDLNHGRVGWRDMPAELEPLADFDDKGNQKILKELLKDLREHLRKIATFAPDGARFVDVKLSWRKEDLLKAADDGDITLALLKKTGFGLPEKTETFYVKELPAANVKSQSATKPK